MDERPDLFWGATMEEMKKGFVYQSQTGCYTCLVCAEKFEKGRVYSLDGLLYDARAAVEIHISSRHASSFDFLLGLGKEYTGFTEQQSRLLKLFYAGLNDREISARLNLSLSTIRNYRFSFREKEKQAKLILAILGQLDTTKKERFISFQPTARMVDQRYAITGEEYQKIISACFKEGPDGPLSHWPQKEKRRLAVLRQLMKKFEAGRQYTEKEINQKLLEAWPDYATLRRYLVEYGFLDRKPDGSRYWVKT